MTTAAVVSVDERLDRIAGQLDAIAAELAAQRDVRETWQELAATLTPVARGALDVATRELQDLSPTSAPTRWPGSCGRSSARCRSSRSRSSSSRAPST